jgi:NTE family protein
MRTNIVTLALQGGGSHGAFTWGVLDRLLQDERIEIEGISGASAGAMNAVVLAHGFTADGRDGARLALRNFWESVATSAPFSFLSEELQTPSAIAALQSNPIAGFNVLRSVTRFFSPHQFNPFDINPLRDILAKQLDFDRLRAECKIKLFIATTQVRTGTLKLFRNKQITLDVLLASACLPALHRAVEIDGEAYWDGGLTANPPVFPLLHQCTARDLILVLLHAHPRPGAPKTVDEIADRLTEIGFSAALFTELQGLALAKREARRGLFALGRVERRLRYLNTHLVDAPEFMSRFSGQSKLNTHAPFIHAMHDEGRKQAELWLDKNFHHLGVRSSFRLASVLN